LSDHPPNQLGMSQWYYALNEQQQGPVEEAELKSLFSSGTIKPDTLIWREGMNDWVPYGEVFAGQTDSSSSNTSTASPEAGPVVDAAGTTSPNTGFGAPVEGTPAARVGLKYDFGDYLCWGVAILLVPCVSLFGYVALLVMFILEFIELKKAVESGKLEESQYSKVHPVLLVLGLFCCSIIFYPLFMHWRNQSGVFKPQPHAVWFAILILVLSIAISVALNGTTALLDVMEQVQAQ